jgi:DNA-binding IclR family transcriptional regulator
VGARRTKAVREGIAGRGRSADRHFVTALARGLTVLSCFRAGDTLLTNGAIATRCKLPKSTVSRLTYTLTETGYLDYVADRAMYRLGSAALEIGTALLARLNVRQLARPVMQELADYSHGVVALGVRVHLGIIYVETCRSQEALTLSLDVGSRVPLVSSAIGRAYYATAGDEERRQIEKELRAEGATKWAAARSTLDKAVAEYARLGCCTSFAQWQPDVNGIAVGVIAVGAGPTMAVNVGGPAFKLTPDFLLDRVRPRLIEVARKIEIALRQD